MDLLSYLQTGTKAKPPTKKRKGKKRKKIKWGTPHPKTGFKSFANKPTTQMDKLLTTITASLLQNPADKIRQQEVLKDYGYSIPIDEAREKIKKFSSAPEGYEDLEEEAARQLAKGKIEEKDINEFLMDRSQQQNPIRYDMLGKEYNLDNVEEQYKEKWIGIDRELDDLLITLNTGGGVETMREEAIQDLKKKRNDIFVEALQQEEFMLEGLTDDNKDYRNKFIKTFKEGQVDFIGKNIDTFGSKILQIDNLLDIKKDNIDFNINDTMNLSPQEAQQELNLVEQEIDQLSPPTQREQGPSNLGYFEDGNFISFNPNNPPPLGQMIFS